MRWSGICGSPSGPAAALSVCAGHQSDTDDRTQVGFNLELGGYFSVKRNTMSINGDTFLAVDQVVPYCKALLEVFRWAPPLRATRPRQALPWHP